MPVPTEPARERHRQRPKPQPLHMLDRDLSWLEFNRRVLHEAVDDRTPLLERALFLTDQRSAWDMQTDGTYVQRRPRGRGTEAGSHVQLMERTRKRRA